jgi:hypothetical protein
MQSDFVANIQVALFKEFLSDIAFFTSSIFCLEQLVIINEKENNVTQMQGGSSQVIKRQLDWKFFNNSLLN